MLFSSLLFLFVYLPVTLAVYFLVPARWRNLWLFIVNLVFYGWGEPVYILLMVFSITLNYVSGLLISRRREKGKTVLTLCIVLNLALLFFFKYYDFLAENLRLIPFLAFLTTHPNPTNSPFQGSGSLLGGSPLNTLGP